MTEENRPHLEPTDSNSEEVGSVDEASAEASRWVTIARYDDSTHAHMARLKLEAESIECVLLDENIVSTNWLYGLAVGGIKLQVPESLASRAAETLREDSPQVSTEPVFDGQDLCPACGSDSIYRARFSKRAFFLSLLLLGAPLPFLTRKMRCARCGLEWIPSANGSER